MPLVTLSGVSIRGRLLLLAAVMFVPFLLVIVFGTYLGRQGAVESTIEQQRARALQVAVQLEGHVDRLRGLLAGAAAAVSDDLRNEKRNDASLRQLWTEVSGTITAISLILPDGRVVASATLSPAARSRLNLSQNEAFRHALETRAFS